MALSTCKECDGKVSTLAKTCPHCGVSKPTIKRKTSNKKKVEPWASTKKLVGGTTTNENLWEGLQREIKEEIKNGKPIMPSGGTYRSSTTSASYENNQSSTSSPSTKANDGAWEKFLDGKLDLAAAFWGFGVFGSVIVGLICGFLAEAVGSFFIFAYIVATLAIISGLWQCADTHKKNMTAQKQSTVWGVLAQAYCVLGGLGLINFIIEYLK